MRILLRGLDNTNSIKCIQFDESQIKTINDLTNYIYSTSAIDQELIFSCNGINMREDEEVFSSNRGIYDVKIIERGGKGGFGSLLKGQPPVKKRTNNFDSCRDLSGRRLRHVNQEKMLREWQAKKMEEEKIIKIYNNPDEEKKVDDYVDSDKKRELIEMNRKYLKEASKSTESIVKSVKYVLKKKRNREEEKINENDRSVEERNILYTNKRNMNNIDHIIEKIEKTNQKKEKSNKTIKIEDLFDDQDDIDGDLEKQLFSI